MDIQKISQYGPDYLILADSPAAASEILKKGCLRVNTFTLALLPWTAEYGSIAVPLNTQVPIIPSTHNHRPIPARNQHLTIQIAGIPPHLCCEPTLHHLFSNISPVTDIIFNRADLTYSLCVNAPATNVPDIAHVAIKKSTPVGDMLYIWTLWYEVTPSEMHDFIEPASPLPTADDIEGKTANTEGNITYKTFLDY